MVDLMGDGAMRCLPEIKVNLQIQPQIRRRSQAAGKTMCHLRGDALTTALDRVDGLERHRQGSSEILLRQGQGLAELMAKYLARMRRRTMGWFHGGALVVVRDLDATGTIRRPDETDPELVIDADGMLSFTVTIEWFEAIIWGRFEILKALSRIH